MNAKECAAALAQAHVGRLACERAGQPYIVPVYIAHDGEHLYGVTTFGQKVEWMRLNPRVCLEVDALTSHCEWMSVVVFGRYEEIVDAPEYASLRTHALNVLQRREHWWQQASVATPQREQRAPVFYRIHIERMTGHRAEPDALEAAELSASRASASDRPP